MICYKTHMGLQACSITAGGSTCTEQFMHPSDVLTSSDKTIFNQTTTNSNTYEDRVHTPKNFNPVPFFSITVDISTTPPEDINPQGKLFSTLWQTTHQISPSLPEKNGVNRDSNCEFVEPPNKVPKRYENLKKIFLHRISLTELGESTAVTKDRHICIPDRSKRMNEGEENESWKKGDSVKYTRDKVKPSSSNFAAENEAPESVASAGSTGSGPNSDNSENSEDLAPTSKTGPQSSRNNSDTQETEQEKADGSSTSSGSTFLFLGPVGKKRRHCRHRMASRDGEREAGSPYSVPATPDPISADQDPPPLVEESSEDSSRSRGSGRNNYETAREEIGTSLHSQVSATTPTRTSVIRSTHRQRRDDQPLNLSLPTDYQQPQVSPRNQREERVSVISIVPRERLEDVDTDHSPTGSPQFHQPPADDGYPEEEENGTFGQPSLSSDFFAISSGSVLSSALSPEAPSSFQGLLMAQGNMPHGGASPVQKKKLRCRDCGKEFSQLRNYKYHRSRHEGTQQFACTCPVCGKTFNDKGYLSSHLKIHRNEKEYRCEWCGKSFNQRVAYNMHIRIHTGHKPHKCSYCPKAFSRKMLLRQHIRTHTGERPYTCGICGKAFADRSNMLLHQRLHSGERPYKCHVCSKSFSKNHHLKTHLNHHAGIKPYQCTKCNACFSQSSNMKTHFRKCNSSSTTATSATSTVTSGALESIPESSTESLTSNIPQIPQNSPSTSFAVGDIPDSIFEEQLQQQRRRHDQFVGLSPSQQQQLLDEISSNLVMGLPHQSGSIPSPLPSPTLRVGYRSNPGQSSSSATTHSPLGFNRGSMMGFSSSSSGMSSRSGLSLLTSGNPNPTSLAAGHPLLPLNTLESASLLGQTTGTPLLSPSASIPSSSMLIPSRRQSTLGQLSPPEFSTITQTLSAQQMTRTARLLQQSIGSPQQNFETQQSDMHSISRMRLQLSPHDIPVPQISPIRQSQLSPRQLHAQMSMPQTLPNYYEVLLPALAVSRPSSQSHSPPQLSPSQQHLRNEMLDMQPSQLARPQDFQRIYRGVPSTRSSSNRLQNQGSQHLLGESNNHSSTSLGHSFPNTATTVAISTTSNSDSWTNSELEHRFLGQQQWRNRGNGSSGGSGGSVKFFKDQYQN